MKFLKKSKRLLQQEQIMFYLQYYCRYTTQEGNIKIFFIKELIMKHWSMFYMVSLLLSAHAAQSSTHTQQYLADLDAQKMQLQACNSSLLFDALMRQEEFYRNHLSMKEINERRLTFQVMNADQEKVGLNMQQRIARMDLLMRDWLKQETSIHEQVKKENSK